MDTIDLMRSFLAVVDTDSFTKAGVKLGRSKALISKQIADLEARLGARLLNRTTRSVGITEIGRAYYERAQQIIADFDNLEDVIRSETGKPRGLLKITAPQTLGEIAMMDAATAFRGRYPDIELDILLTDRTVDLVAEGFDVALRVADMPDSSLIARKLCDMRVHLCASPSYIAQRGRPMQPEKLVDHDCIIDTNIRWRDAWRFQADGKALTVKVRPVFSVNSAVAVREAIAAGLGIGFCPAFAVARDIKAGRLVTIFDDLVLDTYGVYLVYPHRNLLSARVRAFLDFCVGWYTPTPPWERD